MIGALGPGEITIVIVAIFFLFGARRLPELARSIGASARELRRGLGEDALTDDEEP